MAIINLSKLDMKLPISFRDLIENAQSELLYSKLVHQLNKDFSLANLDLDLDPEITPSSLKLILHETLFKLIQEKFAEYLNLLYIVDVCEKKIKNLDGSDALRLSEEVSFLVLQREWQKVWYRTKYS